MEKTKDGDIVFAQDQLCMTELINQKVVGLSIGLIEEHQSQNKVLVLLLKDVNKGPVLHLKGVYVFEKRLIVRKPSLEAATQVDTLIFLTCCRQRMI
ncbi:hypothetical protein IFM89_011172, partial [Coptis chinensis]